MYLHSVHLCTKIYVSGVSFSSWHRSEILFQFEFGRSIQCRWRRRTPSCLWSYFVIKTSVKSMTESFNVKSDKSFWWCNNLLCSILAESAVYFRTVPLSACLSVMIKCRGQSTVTKEVNVKESCTPGTSDCRGQWMTSLVHPVQCECITYSSIQHRGEHGNISSHTRLCEKKLH